jgi:hypothetical protein
VGLVCSSCGVAVESGQEYCLQCGKRLGGSRRSGRVPAWIWASLGALAVAAGGAAAAIAATRDTESAGARTIVALSPLRHAPRAVPPRAKKPRASTRRKSSRTLIQWPAASGYTIVLASIPLRRGIGPAKAIAARALKRGFRQVGVLLSTSYAGLHPGYYVVFTGVYTSVEEAQGKLARAKARFPSAYARQITR